MQTRTQRQTQSGTGSDAGSRDRRPCPICGKPASPAEKPFCSRRCAEIDLHRWLSGAYALPVRPDENVDPPSDQNDPEPD